MQAEGQGGSASARVQLQGVLCARRAGRRARANVANGFAHPLHVREGGAGRAEQGCWQRLQRRAWESGGEGGSAVRVVETVAMVRAAAKGAVEGGNKGGGSNGGGGNRCLGCQAEDREVGAG